MQKIRVRHSEIHSPAVFNNLNHSQGTEKDGANEKD